MNATDLRMIDEYLKCAYQAPEPEGAREWLATLGCQPVVRRNWLSLCHGVGALMLESYRHPHPAVTRGEPTRPVPKLAYIAPKLMRLRMWFPEQQAVFDMQYRRAWLPERERWIPLEGKVQNGWKQSLHALKPTGREPAEGDELRASLQERWTDIATGYPEVQVWLKPDAGLISRDCAIRWLREVWPNLNVEEDPWKKSA